jgi:hypothetical protein
MVSWGGYGGIRTGNLVITSDGKASLSIRRREAKVINLSPDELERLKKIITSINVEDWRKLTNEYCRDCITTVLALYKRGANGLQQAYSLVWDDTTESALPKDAATVVQAVREIEKQLAKR